MHARSDHSRPSEGPRADATVPDGVFTPNTLIFLDLAPLLGLDGRVQAGLLVGLLV